jgi:hypothetical protein
MGSLTEWEELSSCWINSYFLYANIYFFTHKGEQIELKVGLRKLTINLIVNS